MARLATLPRHGQQTSERTRLDIRIETRVLRCSLGRRDAYTRTYSNHMQQEHPSAPQIVDLDRDHQTSSVLLTAQSVANLPLSSFASPLTNAPLLTQKCASRQALPPSPTGPTSNLPPITDLSIPSPNPIGSPFAFTASYPSSRPHPHAFSRRDLDSATDSAHEGLRPKASYHQSLLNLRDELFRPSDSGVCHFRTPVCVCSYADCHCPPRGHVHQPISHARLIWRLQQTSTLPV